jgi:hypothetical protein|tara:strand:+ start:4305 stop:4547 length:243 start_codon:yes stop_codon:yes gene_type:complete
MKDIKLIKKLLQEFKIDELSRNEYKEGNLVMEYVEGYDYPRYVIYYDVDSGDYDMVAEFDSRFFDAQMVETIIQYLQTRG